MLFDSLIEVAWELLVEFAGGNGVLGEMGSQSAVARFLMAHARGLLLIERKQNRS